MTCHQTTSVRYILKLGAGVIFTQESAANHYKFTGKERDSESGLDNFGARYNSSQYGRFMSPDPDDVPPKNRAKVSMILAKKRGRGMSKGKHTEAEMIGALKQMEAGRKAEDVAREVGVSKHTMYAWKAKYGGMEVSEAQEVRQLREENGRLKKLVADLSLDKDALQSVIRKNGWGSPS
jgi:putative transposase